MASNSEHEADLEMPVRRSVALFFSSEDLSELAKIAERFNSFAMSIAIEEKLTCAVIYPDGESKSG